MFACFAGTRSASSVSFHFIRNMSSPVRDNWGDYPGNRYYNQSYLMCRWRLWFFLVLDHGRTLPFCLIFSSWRILLPLNRWLCVSWLRWQQLRKYKQWNIGVSCNFLFLFTFFLLLTVLECGDQFRAIKVFLRLPGVIRFSVTLPFQIIFNLKVNNVKLMFVFGIFWWKLTFPFRVRFCKTFSTEYSSWGASSFDLLMFML